MKKILSAVLACTATMAIAATAIASDPGDTNSTTTKPSIPPSVGASGSTGGDTSSTPAESTPSESKPDDTSKPSESTPDDTSKPSTSEPSTSQPSTSTPAEVEEVEFTVSVSLGADGKLEGAALTDALLTKDGAKCTWSQVEAISFSADGAFSVSFYADQSKFSKDIFVVGVDTLPAARDDDAKWVTSATLTADHVALFDPAKGENAVILEAKDPNTVISASVKVLVEKPASGSNGGNSGNGGSSSNPNTGVALAVAPAGLAVAFVTVAAVLNKKKRG